MIRSMWSSTTTTPPTPSVQTQAERFPTGSRDSERLSLLSGVLWVLSLSNGGLGEGDSQVLVASHVVVVQIDQALDGLLHCRHLDQSHFAILEKLERFHGASGVGEEQSQVVLRHILWDVGEVERGRGREDVLEVFGSRFFEAMERGIGKVLGQALVVQAVAGQCHRLVLRQSHADDLPVHLLAIQVAHC